MVGTIDNPLMYPGLEECFQNPPQHDECSPSLYVENRGVCELNLMRGIPAKGHGQLTRDALGASDNLGQPTDSLYW